MRTTATRATTVATTLRGWRPISTEPSRARRKPTSSSCGWELLRERRAGPAQGQTVPRPQPPPASKVGHRVKSLAMGPLTRGRATATSNGEIGRRSASPSARQEGDTQPWPAPACEGPGASTRAALGQLVEVLVGGSRFLWGKIFNVVILVF